MTIFLARDSSGRSPVIDTPSALGKYKRIAVVMQGVKSPRSFRCCTCRLGKHLEVRHGATKHGTATPKSAPSRENSAAAWLEEDLGDRGGDDAELESTGVTCKK